MANAQKIIVPADRPIVLNGTIRKIHGYGPPGYGENKRTDARITYLVIELPRPINIPCIPEKSEWASIDCRAAKQLKLFFFSRSGDELEKTAKKLIGQRVALTGTVKRADTAGEMTPLYIDVTVIERSTEGL